MTLCWLLPSKIARLLLYLLLTVMASPVALAANSSVSGSQPAHNTQQTIAETLVPADFNIPQQVVLSRLKLLKVDPAYAEQDHQALMAARKQIRQDLGSDWPADNLTLAENKTSLMNDLNAFNQRSNFTYHLLEPASDRVLGCLYISQSSSAQYQASVYYWLIPELYQSPLHQTIRADIKKWLSTSWPFTKVDYSLNRAFSA